MCGITGYLHFDRERPSSEEQLKRMADSLAHRGPDGEGFFVSRNVGLGHRRLAIIDLSTGDQPMFGRNGETVIVFNGEMYNYLELREELKTLGYQFKTQSDTEVALAAYEEWGMDCVRRFNGMWAFALWDEREQRLFCSRDRLGEKPFFYSVHDNTFVFGSEIKALFAYGVPRRLNPEMLDAYLCFTYVPAPYSFFKGVQKLLPGHSLVVERGEVKTFPYWHLQIAEEQEARTDLAAILEEFRTLFLDAVRIRMRSDVPFGAFLSGGLDSGSVVAAMAMNSERPINTFTIGFDEEKFDERRLASLVADRYRTHHRARVVRFDNIDALYQKVLYHFDEPFGDSSALPSLVVSAAARENVTMVLTGDGGDEVLSGYTIHQGEKFARSFASMPRLIRQMLPAGLRTALRIAPTRWRPAVARAKNVVESSNVDLLERIEMKQTGVKPGDRRRLIRTRGEIRPAREFIEEALREVSSNDSFVRLNYWLTRVGLPDDMLVKVDRASMASSLEARVPFLDHRIVELLASVSMKLKLHGYSRKYILRESIGSWLPEGLLRAKKQGFVLPVSEWFLDDRGGFFNAQRNPLEDYIDTEELLSIQDRHRRRLQDSGNALWATKVLFDIANIPS